MAVRRRKFIRVVSYLLAVCAVFAVAGNFSRHAKASYEETLEKVRFEGLNSLCEYMHELSGGLSLLAVSSGDFVADSSYYVGARAVGALGSSACFDSEKTVNIDRFLSSVYDFSQSFSGDEKARETAAKLADYAEEVYYHLSDLTAAVLSGAYSLSEYGSPYMNTEKPFFEDYLDYSNGSENELFALTASVQTAATECVLLSGMETVSCDRAKKTASDVIGIDSVLWREVEDSGENGFAVYSFTHGDTAVEICKAGGILCGFINPEPCAERLYSYDEGLKKAKVFLTRYGYDDLELIGSESGEFTALFQFAPMVNGVLLLTAPIQIGVCLASGNITYFDASAYIKNLRYDVYWQAEIPDISGVLPSNLVLQKTFVCLGNITEKEKLCCLAVCGYENDKVFVYIDIHTLNVLKAEIKNSLPN